MSMAHTKVLLEVQDDRGNVIIAVDSGARFGGTLRRVPESIAVDDVFEVMLVFGDEPATMTLRAATASAWSRGRMIKASVVTVDVGGIHLAPPTPVPHSKAGLSGRLSDVPIAELVQLLCAARRTATVQLRRDGEAIGLMAFVDGRAVCADTTDGRSGADAFYALAGVESGDFEVFYGRAVAEANIHDDTLFLLLEAARRADESRRVVEDVVALDALTEAIDHALTPPALPRRRERRPADKKGEATSPGRRSASTSGLFSGFFDEFSAARDKQAKQVPVAAPGLRAHRATDDVMTSPPFASLAFSTGDAHTGDHDTDIMTKSVSAISAN